MSTLYFEGGCLEGCCHRSNEWIDQIHTAILQALRTQFGPDAEIVGKTRRMPNITILLSYTVNGLQGEDQDLLKAAKDCLEDVYIIAAITDYDPARPPNYPYLCVTTHPQPKPPFKTIWVKERAPSPPPRRNSV